LPVLKKTSSAGWAGKEIPGGTYFATKKDRTFNLMDARPTFSISVLPHFFLPFSSEVSPETLAGAMLFHPSSIAGF
jgi:hypothetical protein